MRKCPACGETVPSAADFCPHCYKDLRDLPSSPPRVLRTPAAVEPAPTTAVEPSTGRSLLMMGLILVAYYTIGGVIVGILTGAGIEPEPVMLLYVLIAKLLITQLAIEGKHSQRTGCLSYLGILVLSFLPIVSWLVMYWAGIGLARKKGKQG